MSTHLHSQLINYRKHNLQTARFVDCVRVYIDYECIARFVAAIVQTMLAPCYWWFASAEDVAFHWPVQLLTGAQAAGALILYSCGLVTGAL